MASGTSSNMFDAKTSLNFNSTIKKGTLITDPVKEVLDEEFCESSDSINNRGSDVEGVINMPQGLITGKNQPAKIRKMSSALSNDSNKSSGRKRELLSRQDLQTRTAEEQKEGTDPFKETPAFSLSEDLKDDEENENIDL